MNESMYNVRSGVITGLVLTVRPCAEGDRFSLLGRDKFCSVFFLKDGETGQFNFILLNFC